MRYVWIIVLTSLLVWAETLVIPEHFIASFEQKITNTNGHILYYKGDLVYGGDARMKWHYNDPTKKEVCSDGKTLTVVDYDLEQVSFYQVEKPLDLQAVLKRAKPYKKQIYLAEYEDRIYTIKVDSRGYIESAAYYDELDNKVQIVFRNVKYGKGVLPIEQTHCRYPSSYDIIRG